MQEVSRDIELVDDMEMFSQNAGKLYRTHNYDDDDDELG